jgi:hypothetical protein
MNEQIKALMGQTLDEKFAGTWSTMDMQDLQKFAERFAELIVKECAGLIDSMDHSSQYFPHVADTIKQHFGVEE